MVGLTVSIACTARRWKLMHQRGTRVREVPWATVQPAELVGLGDTHEVAEAAVIELGRREPAHHADVESLRAAERGATSARGDCDPCTATSGTDRAILSRLSRSAFVKLSTVSLALSHGSSRK
jgi:hypothetical protein